MHTFLFRSYDLIVQSDEADLIRDVCFDIGKARAKLKGIRRRLQGVQEEAAVQVQLLTDADIKPCAAIVAVLLSTSRQGSGAGANRSESAPAADRGSRETATAVVSQSRR